jgi:hypothetical protein
LGCFIFPVATRLLVSWCALVSSHWSRVVLSRVCVACGRSAFLVPSRSRHPLPRIGLTFTRPPATSRWSSVVSHFFDRTRPVALVATRFSHRKRLPLSSEGTDWSVRSSYRAGRRPFTRHISSTRARSSVRPVVARHPSQRPAVERRCLDRRRFTLWTGAMPPGSPPSLSGLQHSKPPGSLTFLSGFRVARSLRAFRSTSRAHHPRSH